MTTLTCPLCNQPMTVITQTYPAKYNKPDLILATCFTEGCALEGVTLTAGDHVQLTANQIAAYQSARITA